LLEAGLTVPAPLDIIFTLVALPPNVFPFILKADVPHVLPLVPERLRVGGSVHCPDAALEINKNKLTKRNTLVIFPYVSFAFYRTSIVTERFYNMKEMLHYL
jgi:hypothetical protein